MTTSPRPNWPLALGLPLLVIIACTIIVFSPLFARNATHLSTAIVLDLTVTAPLLYFLAIRKTRIPRASVIRVFIVGGLAAGLLLGGRSPLLHGIKTWISPAVEAAVAAVAIRKIRQVRRLAKGTTLDVLSQLRQVIAAVFGNERIGDILGSELAVFYYTFARIKKLPQNTFSYARSTGAIPVLGAFMICMVAEGIGLHFLIAHWSPTAAWILTGLSAYTMLQLYAHMRATKARPIRIEGGLLYLRNGLAADACVTITDIEEITLTTRTIPKEAAMKLALLGTLESHTIRIKLHQPVTVVRMFGIRREAKVLLFAVDKPNDLLEAVRNSN